MLYSRREPAVQASRPSEGRAALGAPVPAKCPRCSAPVAGDYKFCPVCAFRLRIDPSDPLPVPPPSPWKRGFLVATALAVGLACVLVGEMLYQPSWLAPTQPATTPPLTFTRSTTYAFPPIGVDDIPRLMRDLQRDQIALFYPVSVLTESDRAKLIARFGEDADKQFKDDLIPARIDYPSKAMAYETTNGMYADFLRDIEANPDRVPQYWRKDAEIGQVEFSLVNHVPRPWQVVDANGEPAGWRLADEARNLPVADVSFVDAVGFAQWASARFHLEGDAALRLPALLEWTRAARGAKTPEAEGQGLWPWGTTRLVYACNNLSFWPTTGRPEFVHYEYREGGYGATNEGLYATAGNVREIALDHSLELVLGDTLEGSYLRWANWEKSPEMAWACGGSFRAGIDDCTVESRIPIDVRERRDDVGFRLFSSPTAPK